MCSSKFACPARVDCPVKMGGRGRVQARMTCVSVCAYYGWSANECRLIPEELVKMSKVIGPDMTENGMNWHCDQYSDEKPLRAQLCIMGQSIVSAFKGPGRAPERIVINTLRTGIKVASSVGNVLAIAGKSRSMTRAVLAKSCTVSSFSNLAAPFLTVCTCYYSLLF